MSLVRIIFIGKTKNITTTTDEVSFERVYKPKGWQLIEEVEKSEQQKVLEELKTDTKIKNYTRMKKVKEQQFDDGLIKKGGE